MTRRSIRQERNIFTRYGNLCVCDREKRACKLNSITSMTTRLYIVALTERERERDEGARAFVGRPYSKITAGNGSRIALANSHPAIEASAKVAE